MKRKPPDDTPERNDTDNEETLRRLAEAERDIVERLRSPQVGAATEIACRLDDLAQEAADEIERLRAGAATTSCEHKSVHDGPRVEARWGTVPTQVCDCGMWRTMHHMPGHWQTGPVPSTERQS